MSRFFKEENDALLILFIQFEDSTAYCIFHAQFVRFHSKINALVNTYVINETRRVDSTVILYGLLLPVDSIQILCLIFIKTV
jgi:hypothetical protein